VDLSSFVFFADLYYTRHMRGEANFEDMGSIVGEINGAYVTLKTNEYVYRSWVQRYWKKAGLKAFVDAMQASTGVYEAVIEFNEQGNENEKVKVLGDRLATLRSGVDRWLSATDE
jgi:hypothetical protein